MERLRCTCLKESSNEKNGEVGMYSKKSSMRVWKGWDVLEGKFNEWMKRFGCTWREV